jgi:transcriptional regulator with XRE-family HTH domain
MNTSTYITDIKKRAFDTGFSMAEVSREAGIDQAQVSRWYSGKTIPLVSSVDKLKQALDRLVAKRMKTLKKDSA